MEQENILDEIYKLLGKFVWFSNENYKVAVTAWVAHTHLIDAFEELVYPTPRLSIISPEKRSGKTRLVEIIKLLVQNPEPSISPSAASLYSVIGKEKLIPTLLIDEIGRLLERKDISEFLSIMEGGFQPGPPITKVSFAHGKRTVDRFKVYAPMLMAGIDNGRMPDTIADRSITLRMRRNIGKRLPYRPRKHAAEGLALAEKLAAWAETVREKVKDVELVMPDKLNDREQDKWEPLFIVAALADTSVPEVTNVTGILRGTWLEKIKNAALELSKEDKEIETVSKGELLLKDLYSIINSDPFSGPERASKTSNLIDGLLDIDESPWSTYNYGRPLDGGGLARLLRPYNIRPKTIRFDKNNTDKGYYTSDFKDAWERYLDISPEIHVTPVTTVSSITDGIPYHGVLAPVP